MLRRLLLAYSDSMWIECGNTITLKWLMCTLQSSDYFMNYKD